MDKKFIEKARDELREDDSRRAQSLVQFRDWLSKHPFLQGVRQDDSYLLQFLRCKKFNVDAAFSCLENNYLAKKRYPQFTDMDEARILKLIKQGTCYPFSERDSEGRRIIMLHAARPSSEEYTVHDVIKLFLYVVMILLEEEETQISGILIIVNNDDLTLSKMMTPVDARDFMDFIKNCATTRQKGNFVMSLPPFANFMVELLKSVMSEKLRSRFHVLKWSDLKNHINQSLLPKEFGGTKTEAEMVADFLKLRDSKKDLANQIINFKVDWARVPEEKFASNVGSFRKLDID